MRRITLQCLYTSGWTELAKLVVPNIVVYCEKHGYSWNIQAVKEPFDGYEKIRQIREIFKHNDADVVVSLDCDLVITNFNTRIEDFLNDTHDAYITKDVNNINCGVFIIKNTTWAHGFLNWILEQKGGEGMYCEQDAFISYMKEFVNTPIKICDHPSFNSYDYTLYKEFPDVTKSEQGMWHPGSFILHLPGTDMQTRLDKIKNTPVIL